MKNIYYAIKGFWIQFRNSFKYLFKEWIEVGKRGYDDR